MKTALINRIIPFSSIDGPGNRMVLFLQGCNYSCSYCHNPETINICNHCGICVPLCPENALRIQDEEGGTKQKVIWKPGLCTNCDKCIDVCPRLSSPKVRRYTTEELFGEIEKAAPFLRGITCSGGEASLQIAFLQELFTIVKQKTKLSCLMDSNGGVDLSDYPEFMEVCDGVMLDLKAGTSTDHLSLSGRDLNPVIENIKYLKSINKLIEIRTVLAPGLNNKAAVQLGASLASNEIPYKLIPYRPYGVREDGLKQHGSDSLSQKELDDCLSLARKLGAEKSIILSLDL